MKDARQVMKMGDLVCYRDQAYRVGACITRTSVEIVELNAPKRGLWVGRDQVHPAQQGNRDAGNRASLAPI